MFVVGQDTADHAGDVADGAEPEPAGGGEGQAGRSDQIQRAAGGVPAVPSYQQG